jgi:hypothetical protein
MLGVNPKSPPPLSFRAPEAPCPAGCAPPVATPEPPRTGTSSRLPFEHFPAAVTKTAARVFSFLAAHAPPSASCAARAWAPLQPVAAARRARRGAPPARSSASSVLPPPPPLPRGRPSRHHAAHVRLRGARAERAVRARRVSGQLQQGCCGVPGEVPVAQRQVHLQRGQAHLQLHRARRLQCAPRVAAGRAAARGRRLRGSWAPARRKKPCVCATRARVAPLAQPPCARADAAPRRCRCCPQPSWRWRTRSLGARFRSASWRKSRTTF